jgi:hypothetical protein
VYVSAADIPSVNLNLEVTSFSPFDVDRGGVVLRLGVSSGRIAKVRTRLTMGMNPAEYEEIWKAA